jgi:hypothetical protein
MIEPVAMAGVPNLSAAQMRCLARICREGDRGIRYPDPFHGRTDIIAKLRKLGLAEWIGSFWVPATYRLRGTALGRLVLVERASDSAFGLAIDPTRTVPRHNRCVFLYGRGNVIGGVAIFGNQIRVQLGTDQIGTVDLFWEAWIDRFGSCIVPGSPSGGFARLLDLAVAAGLEVPEPDEVKP